MALYLPSTVVQLILGVDTAGGELSSGAASGCGSAGVGFGVVLGVGVGSAVFCWGFVVVSVVGKLDSSDVLSLAELASILCEFSKCKLNAAIRMTPITASMTSR